MRLAALTALSLALIHLASAQGGAPLPNRNPNASTEYKLINADEATGQGDEVGLTGNVHVQFRGYDIYADFVKGNLKTEVFHLVGQGKLVGNDSRVIGRSIRVHFRTDEFFFEDATATLSPKVLKGETSGNVYLTSGSGKGRASLFETRNGAMTTCEKANPHFKFVVGSSRVRPGKTAALRDVRIEVLGTTVLGLPYIVIPLIEDGDRYIPDFGQSPDEGYYVKTKVSTPLRGDDYIDTKVDLMQKLGYGVGSEWNYERSALEGKFSAYTLLGPQPSTTIASEHRQRLLGGELALDARYDQQNYLTSPQTSTFRTRASFSMPWGLGSSRLSYTRVSSDRSIFSSVTDSFAFSDNRRLSWGRGEVTSTQLSVAYSRSQNKTGFGQATDSKRVDLRFNAGHQFSTFDADLLYQRSMPVGDSESFFRTSDRTPMLILRTDTRRLFGPSTYRDLPIRSEFSVGELADPASGGQLTRLHFDANGSKTIGDVSATQLRLRGRFRQGVYSDDTAQYTLDYGAGLTYNFGKSERGRESTIGFDYRFLRGFGYTPLTIDRTGRADAMTFNVALRPTNALTFTARTGYDLLLADRGRVPWQLLFLQTEWSPFGRDYNSAKRLRVRMTNIYDTFSQVWSNQRLDVDYINGDFRLGLGARFDGRRSTWASSNIILEGLRFGKTTLALAMNYNGYTQRFDAQHYQLIYDLHCAEAVLDIVDNQVGFRSGRQIGLFVRLKALPSRSGFGQGTRGQRIGGNSGFGF